MGCHLGLVGVCEGWPFLTAIAGNGESFEKLPPAPERSGDQGLQRATT